MRWSMKILVIMIIMLVGALIIISLTTGWMGNANTKFNDFMNWIKDFLSIAEMPQAPS